MITTTQTFPGNSTTTNTEAAGLTPVNVTGNLTSQPLSNTYMITGNLTTQDEAVENSSTSLNSSVISQSELTSTINISSTGIAEAQPTVSMKSGKTTGKI